MKKLLFLIIFAATISACKNPIQQRDEKIKKLLLHASDSISKNRNEPIDSITLVHVDSITLKDFYTYFIHYHQHFITYELSYNKTLSDGDSLEAALKPYVNDTETINALRHEIVISKKEMVQHKKSIDSLSQLLQSPASASFYGYIVQTAFYTTKDGHTNTYVPAFIISANNEIYTYNSDYSK